MAVFTPEMGWHREGDLSLEECKRRADEALSRGWTIYVKVTCQNCQARLTSDKPNTFHTGGYYCDACGETTYPKAYGFAAVYGRMGQ